MPSTTCVLRASGRRFAAKRYLATSTFVPEQVEEHSFECTISRAAADDLPLLIDDIERFLDNPRLDLSRLFAFPGVERVALVLRRSAGGDHPLVLPARVCAAMGKHGLELEVRGA